MKNIWYRLALKKPEISYRCDWLPANKIPYVKEISQTKIDFSRIILDPLA